MKKSIQVFAMLLLACLPLSLLAQGAYPNKPIRMIVPYPPGGPTDVLGRIVAQKLSESLGQQVLIENRPGASGMIGAEMVAKAAPDGYTLLTNASIHIINPSLYPKMNFDALRDFVPVSLIAQVPLILVVNPGLPAKSVQELIALGKAQPDRLNFGSSGNAAAPHLAGESFKIATGVQMQHVPYKGSAPALTDLIGGQVQLIFDSMPSAMPHVKSGKIRALAVTTARRSPTVPDLPTIAESGVPGFDISTWYGVWAPAGTPRDIVNRISSEVAKALQQPAVRERLVALGAEPAGDTPEEFAAYCQSELAKWSKIVRESGAKAD
jgi:tripartite-type tricarboxylate transporter receptor subunit TctC